MKTGTLYLVATPLGNLSDISQRALNVLRSVDLIAAEDTRHSRKLLSYYDIHKPLVSYFSHNLAKRGQELLSRLKQGENIALITDAGTPGISDPGALLVRQALEIDAEVISIPGPVALILALTVSGLPTHPFAFLGFPPSRGSRRRKFFGAFAHLPMTLVLYESPKRLLKTLEDILRFWGDRQVAVARELTKHFEEVYRGTASGALEHFSAGVKGEVTIVVEGAGETEESTSHGEWREELRRLIIGSDESVREAAYSVAAKYGLSKRLVYQEALKIKKVRF